MQTLDEPVIEALASQAAVTEGASAVGMSTWLGKRAVAIASLLETLSPLKGRLAVKVLRQASVYLSNKNARRDVDAVVRSRLASSDLVIVSHSLGTVVAFNLLRDLAGSGIRVPLFVTLGSPLAISEVKRWTGGSHAVPKPVTRWMNCYDKGDPVTLGRSLSENFAKDIDDIVVDNNTDNAHSIAGYLDDEALIEALNAAL